MDLSTVFLIIAAVLFALGSGNRWWAATASPYYPSVISLGLFFMTLSMLWPRLK